MKLHCACQKLNEKTGQAMVYPNELKLIYMREQIYALSVCIQPQRVNPFRTVSPHVAPKESRIQSEIFKTGKTKYLSMYNVITSLETYHSKCSLTFTLLFCNTFFVHDFDIKVHGFIFILLLLFC